MFAFSENSALDQLDPIPTFEVLTKKDAYLTRKKIPNKPVDLTSDLETIIFSVSDLKALIDKENPKDYVVFRFICDDSFRSLSITPVIMQANQTVVKKYFNSTPAAIEQVNRGLVNYQFRKYLLKNEPAFLDECDGVTHTVQDFINWFDKNKNAQSITAFFILGDKNNKKRTDIAIVDSEKIPATVEEFLLTTNDLFSDNGTECCPPR
jgi:hypothetical protein